MSLNASDHQGHWSRQAGRSTPGTGKLTIHLLNDLLKIVSCVQAIFQVITSLFECVKKENDMISNFKYFREETHDLTSDSKEDI